MQPVGIFTAQNGHPLSVGKVGMEGEFPTLMSRARRRTEVDQTDDTDDPVAYYVDYVDY